MDDHILFPELYSEDVMLNSDQAREILDPAIFERLYRCNTLNSDHVVTWAGFNETLGDTYDNYWFYRKSEVDHCARLISSANCESHVLLEMKTICNLSRYRGNFFVRH